MQLIKDVLSVIQSTCAAMIGVQNKEKLKKDFSRKSATPFIIAGLIYAALFVLGLVGLVKLILKLSLADG